jgi:MacB-like periplasmic core domain
MNTVRAVLTGRGEPVIARGPEVSAGFFRILRVQPARGRTFTAEEDRAGAPRVVVLSDALWRERFGADPRVVDRAHWIRFRRAPGGDIAGQAGVADGVTWSGDSVR